MNTPEQTAESLRLLTESITALEQRVQGLAGFIAWQDDQAPDKRLGSNEPAGLPMIEVETLHEILRRLTSNVGALWQLAAVQSAQISAVQLVLCPTVARIENRGVDGVEQEVDRLAASEHARVIADLAAKDPALADALKLSLRKPGPDDSAQRTDRN